MERRYVRQYENFEKVLPDNQEAKGEITVQNAETASNKSFDFKLDDIIIIGILIMLLNEEEKDTSTIILLALLFLSDYIF